MLKSGKERSEGTGPEVLAVKSISRAGTVLMSLGNGHDTVTDISACCGLSKSTVHRLLKALEENLLVSQNPMTHRYYLGPLITQFSLSPRNTHELLITSAHHEMQRLAEISQETVMLNIMIGIQCLRLYEVRGTHDLRITGREGSTLSSLVGATAKALLVQLPEKELERALKCIDIEPVTDRTVTDKDLLVRQLRDIREQGYAVSHGEMIVGVTCIAAPVGAYVLPVAINIAGPENRLSPKEKEVTRELMASTARISGHLSELFSPYIINPAKSR